MSRAMGLDVKYKKNLTKEELIRRLENAKKNAYAEDLKARDVDKSIMNVCDKLYGQAVAYDDRQETFAKLMEYHKENPKIVKELLQQKLIEEVKELENSKEAIKNAENLKKVAEAKEAHARMKAESADNFIFELYERLDIQANEPV